MKHLLLVFTFLYSTTYASTLDDALRALIAQFNIKPLNPIYDDNPNLTQLGAALFQDQRLSGNQNISCQTCHDPRFGTGDGLPLSIGEGGVGEGANRRQAFGGITPRHANHLFNKGHKAFKHMFWDGRVSVRRDGTLNTPEPAINGPNPEAWYIAQLIKTPLEAQALFPIVSETEMFGDNPHGYTNLQKWKLISDRIYAIPQYRAAFQSIFGVQDAQFNIGYIAKALAHFQKVSFQAVNTKWDQYLRGNNDALTANEKRGAKIFFTKGRCATCHIGDHLGGFGFQNTASPQLLTTHRETPDDYGMYGLTGNPKHAYLFRIAPLRNLAYTAPYFHSGSVVTLEQVVEHYNNPWQFLSFYSFTNALYYYPYNYNDYFIEMNNMQIQGRVERLPLTYLRNGPLGLSSEEKSVLVQFLRDGLRE